MRRVNFVMVPPRLRRWLQRAPWLGRHPALLRADQYPLVEPINGVDESLRAGVVRDHDNRLVKLAIELCKQEQDFFRRFGVQVAVGSSATRIVGSVTMARAMATRCSCPPESCRG